MLTVDQNEAISSMKGVNKVFHFSVYSLSLSPPHPRILPYVHGQVTTSESQQDRPAAG